MPCFGRIWNFNIVFMTSHHLTISGSLTNLVFLRNEKVGFWDPHAIFIYFYTALSNFETINWFSWTAMWTLVATLCCSKKLQHSGGPNLWRETRTSSEDPIIIYDNRYSKQKLFINFFLCLVLASFRVLTWIVLRLWRQKQCVPPKCRWSFTRLHGVTTHIAQIWLLSYYLVK